MTTSFWFALDDGDGSAREQVHRHLRHYMNWIPADFVDALAATAGFAGTPAQLRGAGPDRGPGRGRGAAHPDGVGRRAGAPGGRRTGLIPRQRRRGSGARVGAGLGFARANGLGAGLGGTVAHRGAGLGLGGFLLPQSEDAAESLRIVQDEGGRWMAAAGILFISSIFLSLGLPAILTLLQRRGWTVGVISAVVLEVGFIGTAGFAMLMVFFHSLVKVDLIRPRASTTWPPRPGSRSSSTSGSPGSTSASCSSRSPCCAPRPLRCGCRWRCSHVMLFPVSGLLPEYVAKATVMLLVAGFAGIAIAATQPTFRRIS